ncbi:5-oxoprolinase subunit PxpA [Agrobacterium tumefaciens]|uniref:LamB/YcsF family protein n=1 Tax=Agrobacterium tumefaciens TaxID=358 RepID=UPI001ADA1DBC|nr:5-oxoprolinase subunit PxpA [Agrobacterium tumefaciens]QTK81914.1 5-oxoprolinase subunit PxpA [Agrobacterium tumefaciens]
MKTIDLNSDLGEGFGPYRMADDATLLDIVSSANIACGAHAGDPVIMDRTVRDAMARGVALGGHVGYPDRQGFGRRAMSMTLKELELMTIAQLGALSAIAVHAGGRLTHANFHGALGNLSFVDEDVARTLIGALKGFDPDLHFIGLPHTAAFRQAEIHNVQTVGSFLADRGYKPDGTLMARGMAGAVIHDGDTIKQRVARVLQEGVVEAVDGTVIAMPARSILIHSDTEGAVELAKVIRQAVLDAGFVISYFR